MKIIKLWQIFEKIHETDKLQKFEKLGKLDLQLFSLFGDLLFFKNSLKFKVRDLLIFDIRPNRNAPKKIDLPTNFFREFDPYIRPSNKLIIGRNNRPMSLTKKISKKEMTLCQDDFKKVMKNWSSIQLVSCLWSILASYTFLFCIILHQLFPVWPYFFQEKSPNKLKK